MFLWFEGKDKKGGLVMPFVSQAQRAWMHIHHPEMAKRWEKETPKGKKLPKRVSKKKKKGKK